LHRPGGHDVRRRVAAPAPRRAVRQPQARAAELSRWHRAPPRSDPLSGVADCFGPIQSKSKASDEPFPLGLGVDGTAWLLNSHRLRGGTKV
jgi:hypothetical protein